jgi:uncharacterized membrane protein YoaK (UPF0700 family)
LTLITCFPFHFIGSAPKRFVVRAHRLNEDAVVGAEQNQSLGKSDGVPIPEITDRPNTAFDLATRTLRSLSGPVEFAFFGGFADASGYILTGAFTGHVTGAIVVAAISAAGRDWHNFILRLGGVASFMVGVAIAESLAEELRRKLSDYVSTRVIAIELILFFLGYSAIHHHLNSAPMWLVICMSLGLGLQNGVWRRVGGAAAAHTTFLTGLSIKLVATETDEQLLHSGPPARPSSLKLPAGILLAFCLGAMFGSAAALHFHTGAILAAVLLLVLMMTASAVRIETHSSADTP